MVLWLGVAVFLGLQRLAEGEKVVLLWMGRGRGSRAGGLLEVKNKIIKNVRHDWQPVNLLVLGGRPC